MPTLPPAAVAAALAVLLAAGPARGRDDGDGRDVTFEALAPPPDSAPGMSVFILGDLPELGGGDPTRAVKLESFSYPVWKATIRLPSGVSASYRYILRAAGPGQLGQSGNAVAYGAPTRLEVAPAGDRAEPPRTVLFEWAGQRPVLRWRQDGGDFAPAPLVPVRAGRRAGTTLWAAVGLGEAGRGTEFFIADAAGPGRDPAAGAYATPLAAALLQDGELFTYFPAPAVSPARRDYDRNVPGINSLNLPGELKMYKVFLPRGYDEQPWRRYPVLYIHDGQISYDNGQGGGVRADEAAAAMVRSGAMRETILVAVDSGPNRFSDYTAPESGGWADRYAQFMTLELKPRVDAAYRTLADGASTGSLGWSLGGQLSMYLAWDAPWVYGRAGSMSGAWNVGTIGFYARMMSEPRPPIRVYLDSGDAGAAADNFGMTFSLRDNFLARGAPGGGPGPPFVLGRDLLHVVGPGQEHVEAAWRARVPGALAFLYPGWEEHDEIAGMMDGLDVNKDGVVSVDDLYAQAEARLDLNLDGVVSGLDAAFLEGFLRSAAEAAALAKPR